MKHIPATPVGKTSSANTVGLRWRVLTEAAPKGQSSHHVRAAKEYGRLSPGTVADTSACGGGDAGLGGAVRTRLDVDASMWWTSFSRS